jgi:23S rRNA pseudouridine2605 synthase
MRLQKILAQATDLSRRAAETAIQKGEVTVNGKVVTELGAKATPGIDRIAFQGLLLRMPSRRVLIAFNKPRNTMVTTSDPQGRDTIWSYLAKWKGRINPIGRLDFQTEGLLLLTNDGALQNRLTHPKYHVKKIYQVKVEGIASEKQLERLKKGMLVEGEEMGGLEVTPLKSPTPDRLKAKRTLRPAKGGKRTEISKHSWFTVALSEGKYRQIRRMFGAVDLPVIKLKRVRMGPVGLRGLERGDWRELTKDEIAALDAVIGG